MDFMVYLNWCFNLAFGPGRRREPNVVNLRKDKRLSIQSAKSAFHPALTGLCFDKEKQNTV